ncbi:MAG TPA: CAP domain-containing protein [Chitinophagaceae bacterium]|nr:CAP domain-containing protein [Chitinophagaceae bacterium]
MLKPNYSRFVLIFFLISSLAFTPGRSSTDKLTEDVLKYTNQFRKSKGLKAVEMSEDLNAIARKHSNDMASGRCSFGHDGYDLRVSKIKKTIKPCDGYIGENVAFGASNGKEAVDVWKNSSAHRKNMLGDYKYIGIGTARNRQGVIYYTQIFVR